LRYVPLAGGDAAVRQPWRVALAYLRDTFGQRELPELPLFASVGERRLGIVERMIARGINTVPTSSCGRLFDAVSSILNLCHVNTYEGQAAIELEMAAEEDVTEYYPFEITLPEIDMRPAIEQVVRDVARGAAAATIAARFQNTVAKMIVEVCRALQSREGLRRVCLSGGTFQNFSLLHRTIAALRKQGLDVFLHAHVPPNDGGLSLGQAAIANALKP
jgi:hydrogenase maturation protein HypF